MNARTRSTRRDPLCAEALRTNRELRERVSALERTPANRMRRELDAALIAARVYRQLYGIALARNEAIRRQLPVALRGRNATP